VSDNKKKASASEDSSTLDELGVNEEKKNASFLKHPSHEFIQSKFDQVFSSYQASERDDEPHTKLTKPQAEGENELSVEIEFGASFDSSKGEEEMANDDKELDLGADFELSLGDSDSPSETLAADEGLDLSAGSEDGDELTLGDDLGLDENVMAKLAEIDQIMEADATNTMVRPSLSELTGDDGSDEEGLSLDSADLDDGLSLGDEALDDSGDADGLSFDSPDDSDENLLEALGGDDLSAPTDDLSEDSLAMDLLDDAGLDLDAANSFDNVSLGDEAEVENEEEMLFSSPQDSSAPKKSLPSAPTLEVEDATDEEFSFSTSLNVDQEDEQASEVKVVAPIVSASKNEHASMSSAEERGQYKEVVGNYNHQLERLQATLNHLRLDREELLKKISSYEEEKLIQNRMVLGLRAELDEKKIEIQLMKKRTGEDTQDLRYQLELEQERRKMAEEKAKVYQAEVLNMQHKVRLEVKKVSSREKELEQKLELLKVDAETQIRHRDMKILELKRRIDAMEFDLDTLTVNEQKNVGDKSELEDKLDKAIKTLRTAIGILETDDPKLATLEKLKKNLDA
jgi:hypothetical protein